MELSFLSLNVNGLNNNKKRAGLLKYLKINKAQVFFLQETHISYEDRDRFQFSGFEILAQSNFKDKRRGTIILWKNSPVMPKIIYKSESQDGTMSLVITEYENRIWSLIHMYWFPGLGMSTARRQLKDVFGHLKGNIIVVGDFNCVLDASETSNSKPFKTIRITKVLRKWVEEIDVFDSHNFRDKDSLDFSHYSFVYGTQMRIDKIFVSNNITSLITSASIIPCPFSDHNAIVCKLAINFKRLPVISRILAYLINLQEFVDWWSKDDEQFLDINLKEFSNILMVWDSLKAYSYGRIIGWCKSKCRKWEEELLAIQSKIQKIKKAGKGVDLKTNKELEELNKKYQELINHKTAWC